MNITDIFNTPYLIYEYAIIAFITSIVFLLFILPIITWIKSNKGLSARKSVNTVDTEEEVVGLTEIHEKGYEYQQRYDYKDSDDTIYNQEAEYSYDNGSDTKNKVKDKHLSSLIDDIKGDNYNYDKASYLLKNFWNNDIPKLQSRINLEKMLLLKIHNGKFSVEGYSLFALSTLEEIESNLNIPNPLFKKLIDKGKNLYLTGKITKSKTFSCMFLKSEYKKYDQIYLFPISINEKLIAALLIIRSVGVPPLPVKALKMVIGKTNDIAKNNLG